MIQDPSYLLPLSFQLVIPPSFLGIQECLAVGQALLHRGATGAVKPPAKPRGVRADGKALETWKKQKII